MTKYFGKYFILYKILQKLNYIMYITIGSTLVKENIQFGKCLLLNIESFSLTLTQ